MGVFCGTAMGFGFVRVRFSKGCGWLGIVEVRFSVRAMICKGFGLLSRANDRQR